MIEKKTAHVIMKKTLGGLKYEVGLQHLRL